MLFYHEIVAKRGERYHLAGNCVYALNINTAFEIGVVYVLNILPTLNFEMVTFAFHIIFELLRSKQPYRYSLYNFLKS